MPYINPILCVILREEDEEGYEESDGLPSNRSAEEVSLNENNANESQSASLGM